jgi:hypothetical protein
MNGVNAWSSYSCKREKFAYVRFLPRLELHPQETLARHGTARVPVRQFLGSSEVLSKVITRMAPLSFYES